MTSGKKIFISFAFTMIAMLFFSPALTAHAQLVGINDITVSMQPENPSPFQDTTITLSSFLANLDLATIQWSIDGKQVLSGIGKKSYSFKTGAVGQSSTIDVRIDVSGIPTITKRVIITPLEADILWEALDAYTPPFYKGKALLPSEGLIKVVAIPNIKNTDGVLLKPGEFNYVWTRNYNTDDSASGYGKNYFIFRDSYLNDQEKVSVNLSTLSGDYRTAKQATITTIVPNILFYENNPVLGIKYNHAIKSDEYFVVKSAGTAFIAEPYFFSPKNSLSKDLSYTWTVNDADIPTPSIKNIFSLRPSQNGTAKIKVSIENTTKLFQNAAKTLLLSLQTNE